MHLPIQINLHKPFRPFTRLYHRARRTLCLIPDKHHLMSRITQHGLEVIDDAPTRAHAIAGNHDRRPPGALQVIDHLLVAGVGVHADQLTETQRVAPFGKARPGFGIPVVVQFPIYTGNALGQGRVEDDGQLRPVERVAIGGRAGFVQQGLAMKNVFEFVQQLLGAAEAERRNEQCALVSQGAVDGRFQSLMTVACRRVQAVAVGAFQYQYIGPFRGLHWAQQGVATDAEVAGEHVAGAGLRVLHIAFDIGRTQQMPGALQANATGEPWLLDQGVPLLERQGHDQVANELQVPCHLGGLAADAQLVGVFQHQWQQPGGRLAAQDGATVAGSQQCRDAANVVEMHMGDDQGLDALHAETEWCRCCAWRGLGALLQAAVDQQAGGRVEVQLMAGASDAAGATMMGKDGIFHTAHTRLGRK
ncbi:hypothetical protein D3C76_925130 [compost metagenome]